MSPPKGLPFIVSEAERRGLPTSSAYDLNSIDSWGRVLSAFDAPSESTHGERLFTYGLILANRPERVLEIGFRFGGSSFFMCCALLDSGRGKLVSIDPHPESVLDFSRFGDRFVLIHGSSPGAVPSAIDALGGLVNLCFIDGNHSYEAVCADLLAVDTYMAENSYILLHDPAYPDVKRATDEYVAQRPGRVIDCGLVCPWTSSDHWSGLRLLRIVTRP